MRHNIYSYTNERLNQLFFLILKKFFSKRKKYQISTVFLAFCRFYKNTDHWHLHKRSFKMTENRR